MLQGISRVVSRYAKIGVYLDNITNIHNWMTIPSSLLMAIGEAQLNEVVPLDEFVEVSDKNLGADTFVVGDIHGGLPELLVILRSLSLIDDYGNWDGGSKKLIQLGDLVDRGTYTFETYLYMIILQEQAQSWGGSVEIVLGNHEVLYMGNCALEQDVMNLGCNENAEALGKMIRNDFGSKLRMMSANKGADIYYVHAGFGKVDRELFVYEKLLEKKANKVITRSELMLLKRLQIEIAVRLDAERYFDELCMQAEESGDSQKPCVSTVKNYIGNLLGKVNKFVKISNTELIVWMNNNGFTGNHIANWTDGCMSRYLNVLNSVVLKEPYAVGDVPEYLSQNECEAVIRHMVWDRIKFEETVKYGIRQADIIPHAVLQPRIISGHNMTGGAILDNGKNVYIDTGISGYYHEKYNGKNSFLAFNTREKLAISGIMDDDINEWYISLVDIFKHNIDNPDNKMSVFKNKPAEEMNAPIYLGDSDKYKVYRSSERCTFGELMAREKRANEEAARILGIKGCENKLLPDLTEQRPPPPQHVSSAYGMGLSRTLSWLLESFMDFFHTPKNNKYTILK